MSCAATDRSHYPPRGGPSWPSSVAGLTAPAADFCRPVRMDRSTLSPDSGTNGRSPEVSSTAFRTQPPNLQPVPLMDMDFAVTCPLVRHVCLGSGSSTSARRFAPRFFQTLRRRSALAFRYNFASTRLSRGLSPPSCRTCSAHQKKGQPVAGMPPRSNALELRQKLNVAPTCTTRRPCLTVVVPKSGVLTAPVVPLNPRFRVLPPVNDHSGWLRKL